MDVQAEQPPDVTAVVPADYPELRLLAWNRDPGAPIPGAEALALYEAEWRHVDQAALLPEESALIQALVERYGRGCFLGTK